MNPDSSGRQRRDDHPIVPARTTAFVPERTVTAEQTAAANVIRGQIDALYGTSSATQVAAAAAPIASPQAAADAAPETDTNPYHRTHQAHPAPQAEQWQQYHTAWQQYYQKYYEAYYTDAVQKTKESLATAQPTLLASHATPDDSASKDEALFDLRQKLLGRVKERAGKVRRSRHFMPLAAALGVILIFVFIQYNSFFVATVKAYVSPGSIDPQNIVVDPTTNVPVGSEPRLIIPKINVDVPVAYDIGNDNDSQMAAMENGVAHFAIPGASSHPGEIGNTAIAGHSSNDLFDGGMYKFIFAQLEKLEVGDSIYANYQSVRYSYTITKMEVVQPSEIGKLVYPTDKPILTLITCTPLGTARERLLVTAEQVSPDPTQAAAAPASDTATDAAIPGNGKTLIEKLFGSN